LTRYKYPFAIELAEQTGLTGPGVFHPMLRKQLGEEAEIVYVDQSLNMLQQCRKRHASERIELIQANAHCFILEELNPELSMASRLRENETCTL